MNIRWVAHNVLFQVLVKSQSLTPTLQRSIPVDMAPKDVAYVKQLAFGVLRWHDQLKGIEALLLHKPLKPKDQDLSVLVCLGLYELMHLRTPAHAAVNETVSVCQWLKKVWAKGLVNQCLRRFIREQDAIVLTSKENPVSAYAHPAWLISKIKAAYPAHWAEILNANNQKPPQWLRVNQQKGTALTYVETLAAAGIEARTSEHLPYAILINTPQPVSVLPGFEAGWCSVQDLSGQFIPDLLLLKKGQVVLDACAAPGSKTSHLLESEPNLGKLVVIDQSLERLPMVKENIDRLALDHHAVQLVLADASHTAQWWDGAAFDRILLDGPCSATGVIRRHPDIKHLKKDTDLKALQKTQMQLLISLWKTLKKKGVLLYTTCSILPEENDEMIRNFLAHHKDAVLDEISLPVGLKTACGVQLLPTDAGSDGFYFARLIKK